MGVTPLDLLYFTYEIYSQKAFFLHFLFLPLSVCFCSSGVLLQRIPAVDVAAPPDGHPGLHWNALLLCGGEDATLLSRIAGILDQKKNDLGGPETLRQEIA